MMNAFETDMAIILDSFSSVDLTRGTNLYVAEMPDLDTTPNRIVGCYGGPGFDSVGYGRPGIDSEGLLHLERPTGQLRFRYDPRDQEGGRVWAQEIVETLDKTSGLVVGGTRYAAIWLQGTLLFVSTDTKGRPIWTANFRAERSE